MITNHEGSGVICVCYGKGLLSRVWSVMKRYLDVYGNQPQKSF